MRRWLAWICLGCLLLPLMGSDDSRAQNAAQNGTTEPSNASKSSKSTNVPATNVPATNVPATNVPAKNVPAKNVPAKALVITPEREAAALMFVKQHHPELSELLIHLKESSPKEYERAVRDLFRASERLAQIQERDAQAYALELKLWKARSRAQLLSARLQMSDSEELRQSLRSTVEEGYDLQLQLLHRERDRFQDRIKNLDSQIERLTDRRSESISNQFQKLTKSTARAGVPVKANAKTKTNTTTKTNPAKSSATESNATKSNEK